MSLMRALSSRNLRGSANGRSNNRSGGRNAEASRSRFNSAGARYNVLDRAGEGTLFVTYRVRDKDNDRVLALKALKNAYSKHAQFAPVLAQGAAKLLNLEHPHVAQLFEIGEEEGTTFLVTEWLAGQSLEARLRRAPFGRIETLTSTRQIAEGLQFLHDNGIVHGDLRPRQILGAGDGLLKVTDAGTSGAFAAAGISITDVQHDSIYYLAPERTPANVQGDAPATVASDLYALGAIMYRMLCGRVPFAGPSPVAVAMRHRHDEPLAPSRYNTDCAPDLEAIALRLLAKEPHERFASAQEVLDALAPQNKVAPVVDTPVVTTPVAAPVAAEPFVATTPFDNTSSTRSEDVALTEPTLEAETSATNETFTNANANNATLRNATASNATANNISPNVVAPTVFPADLPISAIAAAPLSQMANVAPVAANSVAPTSVVANSSTLVTAASAATSSTRSAAVQTNNQAINQVSNQHVSNQAVNQSSNQSSKVAAAATALTQPGQVSAQTPTWTADDDKEARKKQRRREFWGAFLALLWVLIGLGAFVGIFYGAYYFWEQSAPKNVRVPSYLGKSQVRADEALRKAGLQMGEVSEVFDPKRPAGTVINGNPRPGREVKVGRTVSVTVSRGAEQISAPDFSDLNLIQVRQVLARSGIKIGNITEIYSERVAKGYVCGQFPSPGEAFSRSEPINLVISRGPQPNADVNAPDSLLPPPPPPSTSTSTEDNPLTTSPNSNAAMRNGDAPLVSRTALVRVPVPPKAGDSANTATERNVKIEVRDANGTNTVYDAPHLPGELVDEYVRVTRPQGSSATISIFIDGQLQKQQKV